VTAVRPPEDDDDVPRYWRELGLPGLVDVHVHFLPGPVQAKVW
jgi:dihydroorotase-like cyclic amidohydrolase